MAIVIFILVRNCDNLGPIFIILASINLNLPPSGCTPGESLGPGLPNINVRFILLILDISEKLVLPFSNPGGTVIL